jgi:adenylosuccinate lyase
LEDCERLTWSVGREAAHEAIKEHAVAVALDLRAGAPGNDLVERLAGDERLGLARPDLEALLSDPLDFVGTASAQVAAFVERVDALVAADPEAAAYTPGDIL